MNEKYLEKLMNIEYEAPADLMHVIRYLDFSGRDDLASFLDDIRIDLVHLSFSNDKFGYWDQGALERSTNEYINHQKLSKKEKEQWAKYSVDMINRKVDKKGFAYQQLHKPVVKGLKNVVYSTSDKIKHYKKRLANADKLKLRPGQVQYARSFLESNGVFI